MLKLETSRAKKITIESKEDLQLPFGYILEVDNQYYLSVQKTSSYYKNNFLRLDGSGFDEHIKIILNQHQGKDAKIYEIKGINNG